MIELGKKQKLTVVKSVDFGVYLGEDMQADAKNRVLLPSRQVPEGTKEGDSIEAFIYKDSQDRLIATTKEPKLQVGQTAVLKVSQVTRIGAAIRLKLLRMSVYTVPSSSPQLPLLRRST